MGFTRRTQRHAEWPRGPSNPGAQTGGGMSPIDHAILALLAYKRQTSAAASRPGASTGRLRRGNTVNAPCPRRNGGGLAGGVLAIF